MADRAHHGQIVANKDNCQPTLLLYGAQQAEYLLAYRAIQRRAPARPTLGEAWVSP